MDGETIRGYLSQEVRALLDTYRQFEALVPAERRVGSQHPGEDGRFVESLVRTCLNKFLPRGLEAGTGFIVRPAVKTGENGRERDGDRDAHSTQLDIIVFDSGRYPTFQRFADAVIVPPESVIGIVSVKKTLNLSDIKAECGALRKAAELCRTLDAQGKPRRGPYLALVAMNCSASNMLHGAFDKVSSAYPTSAAPHFDEVIGFIGVVKKGGIFKRRPEPRDSPKWAEFIGHEYGSCEEHLALQFLLTGIGSVYYDATRNDIRRPGFTGFKSGRGADHNLGCVPVSGLRAPAKFGKSSQ